MKSQRRLDEYILFYEKIENGTPDPASQIRQDNHYERAALPADQVAKLSLDIEPQDNQNSIKDKNQK